MAVRTTSSAVTAVLGPAYKTLPDLTPFIETASVVIDDVLAPLNVLTDERLELIERWLSAHMLHQALPRVESQQVDVLMQRFKSKVELGFNNSDYGQTAMRLDPTGTLAALNAQSNSGAGTRTIKGTWLGDDYE